MKILRINEMSIKKSQFQEYDEIEVYDNQYIKVKKGDLYNLVDNDGNLISDKWFDSIKKNNGGGFDVTFTTDDNKVHTGQYLDTQELKKNVEIRSLIKHTDFLDHIDFSDIVLIKPFVLSRPNMKKGVTIIATVVYMGEDLYLGKDGKLYNKDGSLYGDVQFAISQVDIKRTAKKMDEICALLDPLFNERKKSDSFDTDILLTYHISVFAFGFNTNRTNVNYIFSTFRKNMIEKSPIAPWGQKKGINAIKVRFVGDNINTELSHYLVSNFGYDHGDIEQKIDVWTKEYEPTELDTMFDEFNDIINKVKSLDNNVTDMKK